MSFIRLANKVLVMERGVPGGEGRVDVITSLAKSSFRRNSADRGTSKPQLDDCGNALRKRFALTSRLSLRLRLPIDDAVVEFEGEIV